MATKKTSSSGQTSRESTSTARRAPSSEQKSSSSRESTAGSSHTSASRSSQRGDAPRAAAPKKMSGTAVAAAAARQLLELTGRAAEGVTGLERTEDGWKVQVEVVEVRRIPDTTDILALYQVDVDSDGDLLGYRRLRRYGRGVPGED